MNDNSKLSQAAGSIADKWSQSSDSVRQGLHRAWSERLCVGITGLSRSGKSTFITSLINQLYHHDQAQLGGVSAVMSGSLVGVKMHALEDRGLNPFPYDQAIASLSATPPQWPAPTCDISGCLLELKFKNTKNRLKPFQAATRSLFLELRDYPGEWLLDIPLMELSYSSWCAQCSSQFTQLPRSELIGDLLPALQKFDPLAEYDDHECHRLTHLYTEFLRRCKESEHSLSLIQPGRFLIPGTFKGSNILQFFPLIGCSTRTPSQLAAASNNSYYKVFESRYAGYVKDLVIPFYKDFFKPMSRQIVLVDVINALNGGPAYIEDMRQALANISDAFSYGQNNLLTRLFSPKIDQVMFVATKVDQVVAKDHDAVRQLLAAVVRQAMKTVAYEGVTPNIEAISSVRSSIEINDHGDAGISGLDPSGQPVGYIHPNIPSQIPNDADYELFKNWKIPLLNPAANGNYAHNNAIPHIRIDSIIELLIGDQ